MYNTKSDQKTAILNYLQQQLTQQHINTRLDEQNPTLWATDEPHFAIRINLQTARLKLLLYADDWFDTCTRKRKYHLQDPQCFQNAINHIHAFIADQFDEIRQK